MLFDVLLKFIAEGRKHVCFITDSFGSNTKVIFDIMLFHIADIDFQLPANVGEMFQK